MREDFKKSEPLSNVLEDAFIQLPDTCGKSTCHKTFTEEQLMDEWLKNRKEYKVKCPACGEPFVPNLEVTTLSLGATTPYYFFFPPLFVEGIENLVRVEGSAVFYSARFYEEHAVLFWNMVFYFQLIRQPYFMLSLKFDENSVAKLEEYEATHKLKEAREKNLFASLLGQWRKEKELSMSRMFGRSVEESKTEPITPVVSIKEPVEVETILITKGESNKEAKSEGNLTYYTVVTIQSKICIMFCTYHYSCSLHTLRPVSYTHLTLPTICSV
eukprot:TRINITY_DN7995_c0_g1_i3.p1 TRINITY_DN7995_c0_g1~~TRINITY_DN7995_c0_g1_i3.p1  ORF type:complete len:271 (+),score=67.91 TRINITY_DN7995_c0_g1_i3:1444-2256(+)